MLEIKLICPECGNNKFNKSEDGDFECISCGTSSYPENMCSETTEIGTPVKTEPNKTDCSSHFIDMLEGGQKTHQRKQYETLQES